MANTPKWVPMRWPSEWRDPALLELLSGTPINCIVLDWGVLPAPAGLAERAKQAGIAVVALVAEQPDPAAVAATEAPGVAALASAGAVRSSLPVIPWTRRSKLPWRSQSPVLAASDGIWPGVQGGQGSEGGPTGLPWIDSNGWWLRMARVRAPSKAIWIAAEPPRDAAFIRPQHYVLAIADASAHGGRLVLTLDPRLRAALASRAEIALSHWKSITGALGFFEGLRSEMEGMEALGTLGVISDFSGEDEDFSGEILNLVARRGVPYRVILKDRAAAASFEGLRGIIWADQNPAEGALAKKLMEYVSAGGLLVAGAKWPKPAGRPGADTYRRFELYKVGQGRLAISREDPADPYLVAADAQLLLSHRNVPVRLFNTGTLNVYYAGTDGGKRAVLHVINYATRAFGHPVSVVLTSKFSKARIRMPGVPPKTLELTPALDGGVEAHLPPFDLYAAIELEA